MSDKAFAFIYNGKLKEVHNFTNLTLTDLIGIDTQVELIRKNIEAFIAKKPYLDMLLWGARGCGKSSVIKAFVNEYKDRNLKIIQFNANYGDIYELYELILQREGRFILFFDDISFDHRDESFRNFKSIIEGGIEEKPENIMIVATSNKRHLIKDEVLTTDSIYSTDEVNEQMSLFGRFGLIVRFDLPDKNTYLKIVKSYLIKYGVGLYDGWEKEAESYAISKSTRNGRIAKQFAISKLLNL